MAVLGNLLYADSHTDLLTINLRDLNEVTLESRIEEVESPWEESLAELDDKSDPDG